MHLFDLYAELTPMLPLTRKKIINFFMNKNLRLTQLSMLKIELNMELKLREYLSQLNKANFNKIDNEIAKKEGMIKGYKSLARKGIKININAAKTIMNILQELIAKQAQILKNLHLAKPKLLT